MKTILIADAERSARQYLKALIRDSGVSAEVVMECAGGQEALSILREYTVDVLFTAIALPGLDGVELVRQSRELPRPPLTVVVTDQDDLRHVIEMMRSGAEEYLLKPVEPERMAAVLRSLEEKLETARQRRRLIGMLTTRMVFSLLMDQSLTPEEAALLKRIYGPYVETSGYVVCVFPASVHIRQGGKPLLYRQSPSGAVCILTERDLKPFLRSELPDGAAGISAVHHRPEELAQAHSEARAARALAFCLAKHIEHPPVSHGRTAPENARLLTSQARSQRLQLLGTKKREELAAQWSELFQAARELLLAPEDLFGELRAFLQEVPRLYGGSLSGDDMRAAERCGDILDFSDLNAYERFFMAWVLALQEHLGAQQELNRNQARIAQAIRYMEDNYARDLNMAVVSNYISMNYSLFSHLFKLQTGTSFVNYLKQMRVREAQRLLADTDMKVIDISHRVGYVNEKNFMKVFRIFSGVSPSEYRRNMRSGAVEEA